MRARTLVDLLEPATKADPYTEAQVPDWNQPPTVHASVPAAVDPISSEEAVLTAGTVVSRWRCYLDPVEAAAATPKWRVRWRGHDHEIDGEIEVWDGSRGTSYLACTLRRVARG